jgi:hypothetical protein
MGLLFYTERARLLCYATISVSYLGAGDPQGVHRDGTGLVGQEALAGGTMTTPAGVREGLPFVRLSMIISSLAPLFLLWAVRGINPIPDVWLIPVCLGLVVVPNAVLLARLWIARRRHDQRTISVASADDHRDHLLVYLFAMLIPLFESNIGNARDSAATIVALLLVIFLFWHLNLHYMNVLFAVFGYRVFTVQDGEGTRVLVLLSPRTVMPRGAKVEAFRLSNTVYIERRTA